MSVTRKTPWWKQATHHDVEERPIVAFGPDSRGRTWPEDPAVIVTSRRRVWFRALCRFGVHLRAPWVIGWVGAIGTVATVAVMIGLQ